MRMTYCLFLVHKSNCKQCLKYVLILDMKTVYFIRQKKSAYFTFGDLHLRASNAEIYISKEKIAWVSLHNYLRINTCSGKCLEGTETEEILWRC